MDWQNTPVAPIREWMAAEAQELARAHRLDPERVYHILIRTARDDGGKAFSDRLDMVIPEYHARFVYGPSLATALEYLPAEEALTLCEHADLEKWRREEALAIFLQMRASTLPLYTLDELAQALAAFIEYLREERGALVHTGFTRTRIPRPNWLTWLLIALYPTHHFRLVRSSFRRTRRPVQPFDPHSPSSRFSRYRTLGHLRPRVTRVFSLPTWLRMYAAAPLYPNLDPADAGWLEAHRARFFDLQMAVLEALHDAVRLRSAPTLWPTCLNLLTTGLTAKEADYFLRIDRFMGGSDAREAPHDRWRGPFGGLSGLLEVIGDCEEALTVGTFVGLRTTLKRCPTFAWMTAPGFSMSGGEDYRYRDSEEARRVARALETFLARLPALTAFWDGYRERVNDALDRHFTDVVRVTIEVRVPRPVTHKFEPHLRAYSDLLRLHLETTGDVPPLPLTTSEPVTATVANIFRKEGDGWTIRYQGTEFQLRDVKGLRYIACLLRQPGEAIHVLTLVEKVEQPRQLAQPSAYREMTMEQLAEEGLRPGAADNTANSPTIDAPTRHAVRQRLEELAEEINVAHAENDPGLEAVLRQEFDQLIAYLNAETGLGGRPRRQTDAADRARVNVQKLIGAAKVRIGRHCPALKHHFDSSIQTGIRCRYDVDPAKTARWQL